MKIFNWFLIAFFSLAVMAMTAFFGFCAYAFVIKTMWEYEHGMLKHAVAQVVLIVLMVAVVSYTLHDLVKKLIQMAREINK